MSMQDLPPSICFRLQGTNSNRDAIGAAVTIESSAGRADAHAAVRIRISFATQQGCVLRPRRRERARCGLRSAGRAGSCRNFATCRSITGSGSKKAPRLRAWSRSRPRRARCGAPETQKRNREASGTVETWLLAPVMAPDLSLPDLSGKVQTLVRACGERPVLLALLDHRSRRIAGRSLRRAKSHPPLGSARLADRLRVNLDEVRR